MKNKRKKIEIDLSLTDKTIKTVREQIISEKKSKMKNDNVKRHTHTQTPERNTYG